MDDGKKQHFGLVKEKLSHLPVTETAPDVVSSVRNGDVSILTAETGSGKTLLASTALADASDHQVLVLVPRRFLAVNAAEAIAELSETQVGKEVGFAVGKQTGDESQFSPNTKLLFATYGYALKSGLLDSAKTIVLDEVHEEGIDQTLARAVIHRRLQRGDDLRVLEMSATMDAEKQAEYWEDAHGKKDKKPANIFRAEGYAFPCEYREGTDGQTLEQRTVSLIKEGKNGIAVFRPGVGEVEGTATEIERLLHEQGIHNVEIATIYGDMDMEERALATQAPAPGNKKILIGTNVMESGVNIGWLDTGISDGLGKVKYFRDTGAEALITEDLPQWRIIQQKGRVHRFREGLFVLHSDVELQDRPLKQTPEIMRVSANGMVLHTANLGIADPMELKFDYSFPKEKKFTAAREDLRRLGLLTEDWQLTDKGEFVVRFPVGAEAGAMLWAAVHKSPPEALKDTITLASVAETGSLRADFKRGHGMDTTSDVLDALKAFQHLERMGDKVDEEACAKYNVSWKRFKETKLRIKDITERLDGISVPDRSLPDGKERDALLRQIMLYGSINHLFESDDNENYRRLLGPGRSYKRDKSSVVRDEGHHRHFCIGHLREITSGKNPFTIMQGVTPISLKDFLRFAADNPGLLTSIKLEGKSRKKGELPEHFSATYCGAGQRMSLKIPFDRPELLPALVGEGNANILLNRANPDARRKPRGVDNTAARERNEIEERARAAEVDDYDREEGGHDRKSKNRYNNRGGRGGRH